MKTKDFLRQKIAFLASVVEIAISVLVLAAIFVTGLRVVGELVGLAQEPDAYNSFNTFLGLSLIHICCGSRSAEH